MNTLKRNKKQYGVEKMNPEEKHSLHEFQTQLNSWTEIGIIPSSLNNRTWCLQKM